MLRKYKKYRKGEPQPEVTMKLIQITIKESNNLIKISEIINKDPLYFLLFMN